ncbi:MAG: hypothetical protein FJ146_13825 [Deltaproteobacteria bacterium]|nr:hypothetical protein [Deltaproteobacteria bacterium]
MRRLKLTVPRAISSVICVVACTFMSLAAPLQAGSIGLLFGPGNAGNGGSNPVGIPPGGTDIAIKYVTSGNSELTVSLVPGILFGKRFSDGNFYTSLGAGVLVSASGLGLGAYSSFGYLSGTGSGIHFNAEYTQSIGANGKGWTAPGAGRIGAVWSF